MNSQFEVAQVVNPNEIRREMTSNVEAERIGLRNYSYVGRKGDLVAILTQARIGDDEREQPCMVIANARMPRERHVFVPLSQLWQVLQPDALKKVAPKLAQHLYGFITKDDLFRVTDLLFDFADDLKNAKPPKRMSAQAWYEQLARDGFTIHVNGQKVNG